MREIRCLCLEYVLDLVAHATMLCTLLSGLSPLYTIVRANATHIAVVLNHGFPSLVLFYPLISCHDLHTCPSMDFFPIWVVDAIPQIKV